MSTANSELSQTLHAQTTLLSTIPIPPSESTTTTIPSQQNHSSQKYGIRTQKLPWSQIYTGYDPAYLDYYWKGRKQGYMDKNVSEEIHHVLHHNDKHGPPKVSWTNNTTTTTQSNHNDPSSSARLKDRNMLTLSSDSIQPRVVVPHVAPGTKEYGEKYGLFGRNETNPKVTTTNPTLDNINRERENALFHPNTRLYPRTDPHSNVKPTNWPPAPPPPLSHPVHKPNAPADLQGLEGTNNYHNSTLQGFYLC